MSAYDLLAQVRPSKRALRQRAIELRAEARAYDASADVTHYQATFNGVNTREYLRSVASAKRAEAADCEARAEG